MTKGIQFEQIDKWFSEVPSVSDRLRSQKSVFALINLESYVNGLILQWNRIVQEESAGLKSALRASFAASALLYTPRSEKGRWHLKEISAELWKARAVSSLDIHFYLICWDKVNRRFRQLVGLEPHPKIGLAQRPVKVFLEQASRARDFFEHLEEKNQQRHGVVMSGDDELEFRYTDTDKKTKRDLPEKKVKLGKTEVRMIIKAYEDVINALREIDPTAFRSATQVEAPQ